MTELKTVRVSNKKITVIKSNKEQLIPKGADWFDTLYPNIWLVGKKRSGKSSVIANILDHCCDKNTVLIFVVSTIDKDDTYIQTVKKWRKKGAEVLTYTSFKDAEEGNIIENFVVEQQENAAEEEEEKKAIEEEKAQVGKGNFNAPMIFTLANGKTNEQMFYEQQKKALVKEEKKAAAPPKVGKGRKKVSPEFCFVFDDQTDLTRDKSLSRLLKKNRHFKLMNIIGSQDVIDLKPDAIKQMDYVLLFPRINIDKLERVHDNIGLTVSFNKFNELYHDATKEQYNFLYVSRDDQFRHNMTHKYILPKDDSEDASEEETEE